MTFHAEGDWEYYEGGQIRYLRGASSGAYEVQLQGFKPGQTVRVFPGAGSGKARRAAVIGAMEHMQAVTKLRRLNSDDKAMWLLGFLANRGVEATFHVDLGHRV